MPRPLEFQYINHRGEMSLRTLDVDALEFHFNPGYGYQPGWFISGFDMERQARRSFALSRIMFEEIGNLGPGNRVFRLLTVKGS